MTATINLDHLFEDNAFLFHNYKPGPQPDLNVPLLRKVLEHITDNPEQWDQSNYAISDAACGTSYCVAGWTTVFTDHEIEWHWVPDEDCPRGGPMMFGLRTTDGSSIHTVAARELGITTEASMALFCGTNTLADLWEMARLFSDGEISVFDDELVAA